MTHPRDAVNAADAPPAVGPYSHAVRSSSLLYPSGQIALDPATGSMVAGDITAQTVRVFDNLRAVLSAAGMTIEHVVKANVYLTDVAQA